MLELLELNALNIIFAEMQLRRKWLQSHAIKFAKGIDRVRQLLISFNFILLQLHQHLIISYFEFFPSNSFLFFLTIAPTPILILSRFKQLVAPPYVLS